VAGDGPPGPVLPSRDDPLIRTASAAIGGPAGRRVDPGRGWWTVGRVVLALVCVSFALGLWQKSHCREIGWPRSNNQEYVHTCYSDVAHLFLERGFAQGKLPYLDSGDYPPLEYPVLTGAVMAASAAVARTASGVNAQAVRFYDVTSALLLGCAVVLAWAVMQMAGRRPWDAALVAVAPGLILTATINWDLLAAALATLGLLAWARQRPLLAGAVLGLAIATKLYPVLLLGPLVLLCLRAGRQRDAGRLVGAAAGAWVAVNLPVALLAPSGWRSFYAFNEGRGADFGSLWLVLEQSGHPVAHLNLLVAVLLLTGCAGVGLLALRAPRRPRVAALCFLVVAAFCLVNKVYSPQYVLWLVPLAVLARPRVRDLLVWQAGEVAYFVAIWLYLAGGQDPERALRPSVYWLAIGAHVAGLVWLMAMVVRDALRPEGDPVRAEGQDDPAGGVLDRCPDRETAVVPALQGAL